MNTDACQPGERELRLTRRVLEVLHECEHPIALIIKSSLIERDIDLLAAMAAKPPLASSVRRQCRYNADVRQANSICFSSTTPRGTHRET